jgi:hypothetical protein
MVSFHANAFIKGFYVFLTLQSSPVNQAVFQVSGMMWFLDIGKVCL